MGLKIQKLNLFHYRNFEDFTVDFSPSMTVLVGPNAVGKTNTIEALQLLTCGRSFKHSKAENLLQQGANSGKIGLFEEGDGRVIDITLNFTSEKKHFSRNDKRIKTNEVAGELISILFSPDDLNFVKGSPSVRRNEIDDFGSQMNKSYRKLVSQYEKAVEQRNHLLKDPYCDDVILSTWDELISLAGSQLLGYRCALFNRIKKAYETIYYDISQGESSEVKYICNLGNECITWDREMVHTYFIESLANKHADERLRGRTLIGPHRDNLQFFIDGRDAHVFGSQGQQRSVVLAWKMAEVEVVEQIRNEKPLLLLDDVMSELDETRRNALAAYSNKGVQMVISTTNIGYFSDKMLKNAAIVSYKAK